LYYIFLCIGSELGEEHLLGACVCGDELSGCVTAGNLLTRWQTVSVSGRIMLHGGRIRFIVTSSWGWFFIVETCRGFMFMANL